MKITLVRVFGQLEDRQRLPCVNSDNSSQRRCTAARQEGRHGCTGRPLVVIMEAKSLARYNHACRRYQKLYTELVPQPVTVSRRRTTLISLLNNR